MCLNRKCVFQYNYLFLALVPIYFDLLQLTKYLSKAQQIYQ